MAEVRKQKVKCPECGKEMEMDMWSGINLPYDEAEKEKIFNNTFFHVDCPNCGTHSNVAYRFEYNDIDQRYLIIVMPSSDEDVRKEIKVYNNRLKNDNAFKFARAGYKERIVRDNNALREKVLIFDEGLDDRYIEIMKLLHYRVLRNELPEHTEVLGIYFDKHDEGAYHWVVICDDREPTATKIDMDLYEEVKAKWKEKVEAATPEGLARIYGGWAIKLMTS